jgi:hypothetical protein
LERTFDEISTSRRRPVVTLASVTLLRPVAAPGADAVWSLAQRNATRRGEAVAATLRTDSPDAGHALGQPIARPSDLASWIKGNCPQSESWWEMMVRVHLTPGSAALISSALTGAITLTSAWVAHKATRMREREHRVWDRRAPVLEDVVVMQRVWAEDRGHALRLDFQQGESDVTPAETSESFARMYAKLEIYGSDALIAAHEAAFQSMKAWLIAFMDWKQQATTTDQVPPIGTDPLWDRFVDATIQSEQADKLFLLQLRLETLAVRPTSHQRTFRSSRLGNGSQSVRTLPPGS